MAFPRFVSSLRKTLNAECSAKKETVGATLRMTINFAKLQRAVSPKNGIGQYYLGIQL